MAEHELLTVTISRVDGAVFSGDVVSVQLPGIEGEMTILANHKPLISPLSAGTLTITKENGAKENFEITSGTLEISSNHATILI